jgi:CubicO group peptidase (beta-lactamase class C family)
MKPFAIILFVAFLFPAATAGFAEGTDNFTRYLRKTMKAQHIPALSVLVFKGDKTLLERTLENPAVPQRPPLAPDQPFLLASVSKTVTATALLQLYEGGKFGLDDSIAPYLPFPVHIPNHPGKITFRMLLTHTSAIGDGETLYDQYYYGKDSPVALKDFLHDYFSPDGQYYDAGDNFRDFAPGSDFTYSNAGYALIGLLVERISGQGFNAYSKQHIFRPLGMTNTRWRLDEIRGPIVQPYTYGGGVFTPVRHYTFTDYPNGGLRSTARDTGRFLAALASGRGLLAPSTIRQMITPQIPKIDRSVGLGLFLFNRRLGLWGHDGGEQGASTLMAFNPETGIGVVILANISDADLGKILTRAYKAGLHLSGG